MRNLMKLAAVAAMLVVSGTADAAPIVHLTDFIADGTRTHFNNFETLPDVNGADLSPYSNGGITVNQVNPNAGIWTTCTFCGAHQDTRSWYATGGDFGYTVITRTDGLDFIDMGLLVGNGWQLTRAYVYDLRLNDVQVLFGSFNAVASYLGFEGGGFDEVRLIATINPSITEITGGVVNGLQVDNIEAGTGVAPVPEPFTLSLLGAGLAGLGLMRRRK